MQIFSDSNKSLILIIVGFAIIFLVGRGCSKLRGNIENSRIDDVAEKDSVLLETNQANADYTIRIIKYDQLTKSIQFSYVISEIDDCEYITTSKPNAINTIHKENCKNLIHKHKNEISQE